MSAMSSQITGVSIVYSTECSGADQRKHQSSALLAFVRGIHRWTLNSPHKGPVTRKMFPSDDVIMNVESVSMPWRHPWSQSHKHSTFTDIVLKPRKGLWHEAQHFEDMQYQHEPGTSLFCSTAWFITRKKITRGPFYWYGLTLIPTWISNHRPL